MDGDFGKIVEIVEIAKKYQALTYIDGTDCISQGMILSTNTRR
jgi:7-keto-8-aminopelargonate synthetase-like enzyme